VAVLDLSVDEPGDGLQGASDPAAEGRFQACREDQQILGAAARDVDPVRQLQEPRHPRRGDRQDHDLVLVAGGSSQIRRSGPSAVQIHTTARGRRLVKRSRSLQLTALATLVPTQSLAVSAMAAFKLT